MTILEKYNINWFHQLKFNAFDEILVNHKRYTDFNKLGYLMALTESNKLRKKQIIVLRDKFKAQFYKYYEHRVFTHTGLITWLEQLDCENEADFKKLKHFIESALQKAKTKMKKGKEIYNIDRSKSAITHAYIFGFELGGQNEVFEKLNAHLISKKYSFNKRNFFKYMNGGAEFLNSNKERHLLGALPKDVKRNRKLKKKRERILNKKELDRYFEEE